MDKPKKSISLQTQYVKSALLLGSVVVLAAYMAYTEIIKSSSRLTDDAQKISQLLELTSKTSTNIYQLDKAIDTFMLEPERTEQRDIVKNKLEDTLQIIEHLKTRPTIFTLKLNTTLASLSHRIISLGEASELLFNIRISAHKQYPSLAVSAEMMLPVRNKLNTAFSVALTELQEKPNQTITSNFNNLINNQSIWLRTISEYRLYLTNRFGSFNNKQMLEQESLIEAQVARLRKGVNTLIKPAEDGKFGFQGTDYILSLPGLIDDWETAYLAVKKINHSKNWRRDSEVMRSTIIPLTNEISVLLEKINSALKDKNHQLMLNLKDSGNYQTYILAGVISSLLIYIIASFFLLKILLLKPISLMAKTLKEEAHNPSSLIKLDLNKTRETEDLIEAFTTMGKQVASRQKELEHHALHDSLTSLPNRMLLNQRLEYQTLIASREKSKFTLLFLDLNRFKEINDTLGHHFGDELLIQTSNRLSALIRKVDTVARLGGDEFAILLPNTERHQAVVVALKISQSLKKEFSIDSYSLQISSSIGIAEFPDDGDDVNTMIQHADIAMYSSKKNKSLYEFYDPQEDTHSLAQLSLGRDLKSAIENNQLEIYFQPKVNLLTGGISGAEALLRWNHPEHGFINPEKIIEISEHVGLINNLSYWIIEHAISGCAHNQLPEDFDLSINLAVQNLRDSYLITETMSAINNHASYKGSITFEVTESAMMSNPEQSINILNELKKRGINISIDDFGTGFSSLAYLKQLPVSQLKIDKSFVMDMQKSESDRTIVFSTINLSHSLGLNVVAEGVEDKSTLQLLQQMDCDIAQGYLFSKPVPAREFHRFYTTYRPDNFDL